MAEISVNPRFYGFHSDVKKVEYIYFLYTFYFFLISDYLSREVRRASAAAPQGKMWKSQTVSKKYQRRMQIYSPTTCWESLGTSSGLCDVALKPIKSLFHVDLAYG